MTNICAIIHFLFFSFFNKSITLETSQFKAKLASLQGNGFFKEIKR